MNSLKRNGGTRHSFCSLSHQPKKFNLSHPQTLHTNKLQNLGVIYSLEDSHEMIQTETLNLF